MDRRLITTAASALVVMLSFACQEDSKKKNTESAAPVGLAGTSFDAEEFSCKKKAQTKGANLITADAPTWDDGIKSLMQSKCLPCHAAGATPPDLSSYQETAETVDDNLERIERTGAGVMPPAGKLPQDDIDLFKAWLDAGTPKSSDAGGTSDGSADEDDDADADGDADADDEDADQEGDSTGKYDSKLCPNAARGDDAKNQN